MVTVLGPGKSLDVVEVSLPLLALGITTRGL